MPDQEQSVDLGPWVEWTPEEILDEIYGGPARVIPAPADDDDGAVVGDG